MKYVQIFILTLIILLNIILIALIWNLFLDVDSVKKDLEIIKENTNQENSEHRETNEQLPVAETHNDTYDFGLISKDDGKVSTTFEIENHGKGTLEIGDITTSCACTTANIEKKSLSFNEETQLTIIFDPNLHDEPKDRFKRSIYVPTNDSEMPELVFDIYVDIIED